LGIPNSNFTLVVFMTRKCLLLGRCKGIGDAPEAMVIACQAAGACCAQQIPDVFFDTGEQQRPAGFFLAGLEFEDDRQGGAIEVGAFLQGEDHDFDDCIGFGPVCDHR